jgi:hypothetical protein
MLSPEQKEAYANLERAIQDVLRVREVEGLLVEYVTVCSVQRFDEDGDPLSSVMMLLPNGSGAPYHRIMGLVEYAQIVMRAEVARNELEARGDDDSG